MPAGASWTTRGAEGAMRRMGAGYARMASRRRFVAAGGSAVIATGLLAIPAGCRGKFYPGTVVLGDLDVGGMTRGQAEALVSARIASFRTAAVTFRHDDRTWIASLDDLGARIDTRTLLDRAAQRGRDGGVLGRYTTWFSGHEPEERIPAPVSIDDDLLIAYLRGIAAEVDVAPANAGLVRDGTDLRIEEARAGTAIDIDAAARQTRALLARLQPATIDLLTVPTAPAITASDLEPFRKRAAALIADPVIVADERTGASWSIEPDDLAQALALPTGSLDAQIAPVLDPTALRDTVAPIAEALWLPPVNASVGWDEGPFILSDAQAGRSVDADALAQAVAHAATTESRVAFPPTVEIPADVSAATLPTLGLDAVLGAGDSSFAGSAEARAENVLVASRHITGTMIAPGAQFSFNDALGPITTGNGYVEGKIIQGDWYASDLGGGVCQVSTTVFRAALLAGMHFDEWHPHSFRVSFYELDGWPPGIDAAIYQPNTPDEWELDLTFTNTSGSWMLVQMIEGSEHITAQLIGRPDGISVALGTPRLSDPLPPPSTQERPTDSLPAGQRELLQSAAPGVVVTLTRTFRKDGIVIDEDTFTSEYAAQPEIWQIGTGPASASD